VLLIKLGLEAKSTPLCKILSKLDIQDIMFLKIFKVATVCNLGFSNFWLPIGSERLMCIAIQISSKSVKRLLRYRIALNNFQNGSHLPCWIYKSLIFWTAGKLWRTNMYHRAKFAMQPNSWWIHRVTVLYKWSYISLHTVNGKLTPVHIIFQPIHVYVLQNLW